MPRPPLRALVLACGLLVAPSLRAIAADADFLDRYAATRGFRSGHPAAIAIPHDADEVLFLRSGPRDRVQSLWAWDVRSKTEREVLTGEKLLAGAEETLSPEE